MAVYTTAMRTPVTERLEAWLREEGARDAMVYAEPANPASNGLYQSVGFRPIAVHRKYAAPALQSVR